MTTSKKIVKTDFENAKYLVEQRLQKIRNNVTHRIFNPNKVAEIEINEFFFNGAAVNRVMVVLRATGCEAYKTTNGCSMCAHFDGTPNESVTYQQYINQWKSVINGSAMENNKKFDINDYPILCLYNLGSLLNPNEVPSEAVREIFSSINNYKGIKKTIIESRAEYVTVESLKNIREVYDGILEIGIGLESSNQKIRELCHHKNMPDLKIFENAIKNIHNINFKALTYVNQKPPFLTEKEAIEDAITTSVYAYEVGSDAVSIEPTSLQLNSLTDHLYTLGEYRVPWLWSVREVARGIYSRFNNQSIDLRLGGYFDEEVLSGSQGVAPNTSRNELFPHQTAANCNHCTENFITAIKMFNKTYNLDILNKQENCSHCYDLWQHALQISDSRNIEQRIIDTLGLMDKK